MQPNDLSSVLGTPAAPPEANERTDLMGRDDFLRMLIAQLENQDPLSPQDPTQFTAQLAQFSTLEQLIAIRTSMDDLAGGDASQSILAASSLIGRDVLVDSAHLPVAGGGAPPPEVELVVTEATSTTELSILDARGREVRRFDLGALAQGSHAVPWDGLDASGQPLAPGTYSLRVEAARDGLPVAASTRVRAQATGALPASGDRPAQLLLGDLAVGLDQVVEIREGSGS